MTDDCRRRNLYTPAIKIPTQHASSRAISRRTRNACVRHSTSTRELPLRERGGRNRSRLGLRQARERAARGVELNIARRRERLGRASARHRRGLIAFAVVYVVHVVYVVVVIDARAGRDVSPVGSVDVGRASDDSPKRRRHPRCRQRGVRRRCLRRFARLVRRGIRTARRRRSRMRVVMNVNITCAN